MKRTAQVTKTVIVYLPAMTMLSLSLPALAESPANWAPKDALLYVGVPDCDALWESHKNTSSYRASQDPAAKKSVDSFERFKKNALKLIAKKLGLESSRTLEIYPHKGLAFFVSAAKGSGEDEPPDLHVGLAMDMGDDAESAQLVVQKVIQTSSENGGRKETIEIRGTKITTIKFDADSEADEANGNQQGNSAVGHAGQGPDHPEWLEELFDGVELDDAMSFYASEALSGLSAPAEFAVAFKGTTLIVGSDTDTVKSTLKRMRADDENSLAASKGMRSLRRNCGKDGQLQFLFDWPSMLEATGAHDRDERKALGLAGIGPLVLSAKLAPEPGIDARMQAFMAVGAERIGIAKLLMMKNIKTAPPSFVSQDTAIYVSINLDPGGILREILDITGRVDPEQAEEMRASLKTPMPDGSVMDLQKNVIEQLKGPLSLAVSLAKPYDPDNVNLLLSLRHRSRDAMAKLLGLIPQGMLVPSEMMGSTVYTSLMMPGAAMGLTDQAIVPVATKNAVEALIRNEGKEGRGLASDPEFKHLAKQLPAQCWGVAYTNSVKLYEASQAIRKAGDIDADYQWMPGMPFANLIRAALFNLDSAQNVDDLTARRKYAQIIMMTVTTEAKGLKFELVSADPQSKN